MDGWNAHTTSMVVSSTFQLVVVPSSSIVPIGPLLIAKDPLVNITFCFTSLSSHYQGSARLVGVDVIRKDSQFQVVVQLVASLEPKAMTMPQTPIAQVV